MNCHLTVHYANNLRGRLEHGVAFPEGNGWAWEIPQQTVATGRQTLSAIYPPDNAADMFE
jgi:hypothetical protein